MEYPIQAEKLTLAPDDIVVIHVPGRITEDIAERIRVSVKDKFPNHVVMVLSEGMTIGAVSRGEA